MKLNQITLALFSISVASSAMAEANEQELQNVTIKAKAVKSFSRASDGDLKDRVNLGLLGKQNAFTTPITVINYDEKYLNDSAPRTLVDSVAKTDASTMVFGGESNTLQGLYIRGLQVDARQFSVNGLAGMYSYQSSPSAAVSSAQLIKGASSALNGMDPEGAVSGAVNIETKKATDKPITKIGVGYFSDSRPQVSADVARRFGANKEWGARVNGLWRKGDTARDNYSEHNREFAFNGDYRGENLRVALDAMYSKRHTQAGRARIQDLQLLSFALPAAPDNKTSLVPSWQGQTSKDQTTMLTFEYDAPRNIQISGGIGYNKSNYSGFFSQLNAATSSKTGRVTTLISPNGDYYVGNNATNGGRLTDQTAKTLSMNLAARGEFETGSITHNWNTAYDRVRRSRVNYWGSAYTRSIRTNFYAPNFGSQTDEPYIAPLSSTPAVDSVYTSDSIALSDTLGFAEGKYRLTMGGRLQWIKQSNNLKDEKGSAHRFSPMLLGAWVPSHDLVVYGNYMEDLEPGEIDSETGAMAKPRVSKQVEIGVRKNWGDFVSSVNMFQISRPGYWRGNATANSDFNRLNATAGMAQGKERNRGIEFNTYANLLNKTLRPSIGLMYMHAKLKNYPNYADNLVNGYQVASPRVIAKAGVEWDTPFVQGLTVSAHAQHYGKSYQDTARQYKLPSYTLFDIGAKYSTKVMRDTKLTVSGAVENVFNKNYWQVQRGQYDRSFAVLGMPRTIWVKADFEF